MFTADKVSYFCGAGDSQWMSEIVLKITMHIVENHRVFHYRHVVIYLYFVNST